MTGSLSPLPDDLRDAIAGNAAIVRDKVLAPEGVDPEDHYAAVEYLDRYIENVRLGRSADKQRKIAGVIGSYLGEAIIAVYGGAWTMMDGLPVVAFGPGDAASPISKTEKQIEHGAEDSIFSFFNSIPMVFAGRLPQVRPSQES